MKVLATSRMYALVQNKKVVQIVDSFDKTFPVHISMSWRPCTAETQVGWTETNDGFVPPSAEQPKRVEVKQELRAKIQNDAGIRALVLGLAQLKGEDPAETQEWLETLV